MRRHASFCVVLLLLAATASSGQVVPVFTGGDVTFGVYATTERSGPVQSLSFNWAGTVFSPYTDKPVADVRNLTVRALPNMKTVISLELRKVEWRDRGVAASGQRIFAEYAVQRIGDTKMRAAYAPTDVQLIDEVGELHNKQPSGILTITLPEEGRWFKPGSYVVSVRFFLAKYDRAKFAGDLPIVGRALTFSQRSETVAYYGIPFTVLDVDTVPQNDAELVRLIPYMGMNPIMINAPRAPVDQTAQFAEVVRQLQAQIAGLEQKLNAATSRPDLPEFRSSVPLKPNGGEAAPRRERGTKPASDDEGGEVRTADAGDVTPPADTSTADKSGSDNEGALVPEKPRTRNVVVVFAFRDDTGRIIRDQRGRLSVTAPDSHEPIAVTGQTEFRLQLPDDGQKHRFDFKAMKSGREWLPGYYTVDPDERRVRIYYTCRR